MEVEIFNIAMAKEITDAVDTSLKKWKASLLEVRELTEDGITGTDHPLFIATKAAADLHESTFHSCLARTNARAQKGQEERFAGTTKNEESKAEDADDIEHSIEDIVDDPYDDNLSVNKDNFNNVS
jgi:phage baseplate assembly protein W